MLLLVIRKTSFTYLETQR